MSALDVSMDNNLLKKCVQIPTSLLNDKLK